jgi:hypothetical protein
MYCATGESKTKKKCSPNLLPKNVKIKHKTVILPAILCECKIWSLALIRTAPTQGAPEQAIENNGNKDGGRNKVRKKFIKRSKRLVKH